MQDKLPMRYSMFKQQWQAMIDFFLCVADASPVQTLLTSADRFSTLKLNQPFSNSHFSHVGVDGFDAAPWAQSC